MEAATRMVLLNRQARDHTWDIHRSPILKVIEILQMTLVKRSFLSIFHQTMLETGIQRPLLESSIRIGEAHL